jgi:hypothetical protein
MQTLGGGGIFSVIQIASKFGASVTNCVKLENFSAVGQATVQSAQKCITDKLNEITSIVTETTGSFVNATQDVDSLRRNMDSCTQKDYTGQDVMVSTVSRLFCYQAALFGIQRDTLLLPVKIAHQISKADELISTARPYMLQCAANLADALAGTTFDVGLAMGRCVGEQNQ